MSDKNVTHAETGERAAIKVKYLFAGSRVFVARHFRSCSFFHGFIAKILDVLSKLATYKSLATERGSGMKENEYEERVSEYPFNTARSVMM